jgi:tetratricopeptide (TPR) repeat protein
MRELLLLLVASSILITACNSEGEKPKNSEYAKAGLLTQIEKVEATLFSAENKAMNMGEAQEVIGLYKEYVNQFPGEIVAAEYLFKAADVSLGLGRHKEAQALLKRIIKDYNAFNKLVEVYYLNAFIYDVHLKQKGAAEQAYQLVIEKFPEHKLADDASAAKKILTMSDEDLLKMFEEKNR